MIRAKEKNKVGTEKRSWAREGGEFEIANWNCEIDRISEKKIFE